MTITRTTSFIGLVLALALVLSGCDSTVGPNGPGDQDAAPLTLAFQTTASTSSGANLTAQSSVLDDNSGNSITLTRVEIAISEIEFESANGRADIEDGPILVDLPLDGGPPRTIIEASIPEGVWDEIEFEVDKLERDDPAEAALLDETGFPEGFSIRVEGVWTPADGPERNFTLLSDLDEEQEIELEPPIEVTAESPKTINFVVDVGSWFRQSDGTLVNPEEGNEGGRFEDLIEDNIERSIEAEDDDDIEVEGRITNLTGSSLTVRDTTFEVTNRTRVKGDNGDTLTFSDLLIGDKVEVEGREDLNGTLVATEIELEFDEVNVNGSVEAVGTDDITVNGLTFRVTNRTEIEDDDGDLSLSDLAVGDNVEVEGFFNRDGVLIADEIEREDDDFKNEVEVEGLIESLTDDSLTVNGITFFVTGQTEIEDENERPISFDDLQEGDDVEVDGFRDSNGDLIAEAIELEE